MVGDSQMVANWAWSWIDSDFYDVKIVINNNTTIASNNNNNDEE